MTGWLEASSWRMDSKELKAGVTDDGDEADNADDVGASSTQGGETRS